MALVCAARSAGARIEVIGARHSWSDIAMGDEILVSLDELRAVIEIDRERGRVRVQAGVRLFQLNELLAAEGLALAIVGSVVETARELDPDGLFRGRFLDRVLAQPGSQ